jgi:hypothetical protein
LVVAHPGHEIRVHGWLARARPLVFILTDGSGRSNLSRLGATTACLREAGVRHGPLYGRFSDREIYRSLLVHDFSLFINLVNELVESFRRERIALVVGDAAEGYNSTHDLCRLLVNAAVEMVNKPGAEASIVNYDFPVVDRPDSCPEPLRDAAVRLHLDEATFAAKLSAARRHYPELVAEMETALSRTGASPLRRYLEAQREPQPSVAVETCLNMFRVEVLRLAGGHEQFEAFSRRKPFYESQGERQVAEGHYAETIRYREHLAPLADALKEHVERNA